ATRPSSAATSTAWTRCESGSRGGNGVHPADCGKEKGEGHSSDGRACSSCHSRGEGAFEGSGEQVCACGKSSSEANQEGCTEEASLEEGHQEALIWPGFSLRPSAYSLRLCG